MSKYILELGFKTGVSNGILDHILHAKIFNLNLSVAKSDQILDFLLYGSVVSGSGPGSKKLSLTNLKV